MYPFAHGGQPKSDIDIELWKHHASFGGEDKNRMVTIASFLLGFSVAILGVTIALPMNEGAWIEFAYPGRAILISFLGINVSAIAAYVVILYAGYSNQNWRTAGAIAEGKTWQGMTNPPEWTPDTSQKRLMALRGKWGLIALSEKWARPCNPQKEFAPVFIVFFVLSCLFISLHIAVMITASIQL